MMMMLRAHFDVEAANLTINEGSAGPVIDKAFAVAKPEAVYFVADKGQRGVVAFFDLVSADQMPAISEPLFQAFGATVEFLPVMTPDDLMKGLQAYAASR
jgi:hypothetical protein